MWAYKDTGCISGEGICEFHHYLRVKKFLTLKRKTVSERTGSTSSKAVGCDVCPVREDTSAQLHGSLLAWPCPTFLSRSCPHSRWDFKIMLKITHNKKLQGRKKYWKTLKGESESVSIWCSCYGNHLDAKAGVVPGHHVEGSGQESVCRGPCCLNPVMFWSELVQRVPTVVLSAEVQSWGNNSSRGVTPHDWFLWWCLSDWL